MATTRRTRPLPDRLKAAVDDRLAAATAVGAANSNPASRAIGASYEAATRRLVVRLANEVEFRVPVVQVEGLGALPESTIREVTVDGAGHGLYWPSIDLDLSVSALLAGCFGTKAWMATLGRQGGQARTNAKQRAARENGKKGGRPRKSIDRIVVPIRADQREGHKLVSRAQARRLVHRFDTFGHVVLDFAQVDEIGQAFADELFRVFAANHPEIQLIPKNVGPEVAKMIQRATSGSRSGSHS